MTALREQMLINANADASLSAAFARHAASRADAAVARGIFSRFAFPRFPLRLELLVPRNGRRTVPAVDFRI